MRFVMKPNWKQTHALTLLWFKTKASLPSLIPKHSIALLDDDFAEKWSQRESFWQWCQAGALGALHLYGNITPHCPFAWDNNWQVIQRRWLPTCPKKAADDNNQHDLLPSFSQQAVVTLCIVSPQLHKEISLKTRKNIDKVVWLQVSHPTGGERTDLTDHCINL